LLHTVLNVNQNINVMCDVHHKIVSLTNAIVGILVVAILIYFSLNQSIIYINKPCHIFVSHLNGFMEYANLEFATKICLLCQLLVMISRNLNLVAAILNFCCKKNCSRMTTCHPAEICSGGSNLQETTIKHCMYSETHFSVQLLDYQ